MSREQVREMVEQLGTASSSDERKRIAEEIRAVGPGAVPALIAALGHDDRFVRMTAADILGQLEAAEAVPALVQTMGDEFVRVQRAGMRALISIGRPVIEQAKAACGSRNLRIQRHALTVLRRLGVDDAVEQALEALQSENGGVRGEAAKLLAASSDEAAFEALVDCLSDEDLFETAGHELIGLGERGREVLLAAVQGDDRIARRAAALALAKEGGPEALGALLDSYAQDELPVGFEAPGFIEAALAAGREVPFERLLEQASGAYRDLAEPYSYHQQRPAIEALGKIGDARAIPTLKELLDSEHAVIARLAAAALGEIGTAECVDLLVEALGHPKPFRGRAALALVRLGEAALEAVLAALGSENRAQRENAGHVLSEWGEGAVPGVLQAAASENPVERWGALWAINVLVRKHANTITDEVRSVVIGALDDDDAKVRRWAARAEREIRDMAAIPALIAHLTDEDRQMRRYSRESLASLGEGAVEALVQSLENSSSTWQSQMLGKALGAMGEAAVKPVLSLLDDSNPLVRSAAGWALGECGSPEALPGLVRLARADDGHVAAAAMWGLGGFFTDEAAEALDYIANNQKLDKGLRRHARVAAREVRERLRLAEDEPPEDEQR